MAQKYRASIMMVGFALLCAGIHFYSGWRSAIDQAAQHQQAAMFSEYLVEWVRDTFENLQSEFWQLAVQFALLAGLFEFMRVRAYEDDLEQVKDQLSRVETLLRERS